MGYFSINDPEYVFRIQTNWNDYDRSEYYRYTGYYCLSFGSPNTLIEMTLDNFTNKIMEIECLYLGEVFHEPAVKSPYFGSKPRLIGDVPECYEDKTGYRLPCVVNLTRNELTLIFASNLEPKLYFADERAEYYYSDELDLLYIKVVDLTAEEYAFLNR